VRNTALVDHSTPESTARFDGRSGEELAAILGLPRVVLFAEVASTLDVTHDLGEQGAPEGTLVLADAQTAGRGRMRRAWRSDPGAGVWLTLLERPAGDDALGVLALRLALALAPRLDAFSPAPVQLKWPNDLYVGGKKLAGVLAEARWRGTRLDWLAVGVGINVRSPNGMDAAGLSSGTQRVDVLRAIVPALREAVAARGLLIRAEIARFRERDMASGRRCVAPAAGTVAGIDVDGALLVDQPDGRNAYRAGSLVLDSEVDSLGGLA
jgi:BirA family transcriptional regulator, biotin operon repressor / biotin---[acetyl-CoA-carboxylase] ligase